MTDFSQIQPALDASLTGMTVLGGFYPDAGDGPETIVLVGNAGPAMWAAFDAGREKEADPLDAWTRRVLEPVAASLGAEALFPFTGPPYHPFQAWALKAGGVFPSPIGPLIHPRFGLWHAYRGALAFPERLEIPATDPGSSPCDGCRDRPCLSACPVDALAETEGVFAYDVPACARHLDGEGADCLDFGCLARRACPVGRDQTYAPDQAHFHMEAFAAKYCPR